ncbi:two pore domain potassium channel family protein [Cryobacterium sp. TMT1-21]|uniref:Two pore domain potassium channel family protein n=2 Tax=Cryobacterium TaxID=69578 RepID=A0AAQ2HFW4_9MICO|nr:MULTISPECIES: potassium channel family protein [Cryobacterium]TFC47091.1 two pore domain potassium channel family protein [Cryobacterium shii]TFC88196.1 two pore domain potassium channel family protein [Cryobacterium sp. TmT2-59]TFD13830.1 two pore domain potassium channel family protein [Cryobacterium sp. TMT1-21]TFD37945.1 two pore domain potassium channel family protein [Cryobacterium sp. TMT2-10]
MDQARWDRLVQWPLLAASVLFLLSYSWRVLADLDGPRYTLTFAILVLAWLVFLADYLVNLYLAPQRGRWFITHLFDLLVVFLPVLRPLRLLRLVTMLPVFQKTPGSAVRSRVGLYLVGASSLLICMGALAVLDAERASPRANITTIGDSVWWAFVTVSTMGYGDYFPVTGVGRLITVGLMLGGVTLVGVITATLASWIIDRIAAVGQDQRSRAGKH